MYSRNLELLARRQPTLAKRVEGASVPDCIQILRAKNGKPVPKISNITLHSLYHPEKEAQKFAENFNPEEGTRPAIYGLGFGYHIRELLHEGVEDILVVEPSLELFCAFLQNVDIKPFLPTVKFCVAEPPARVLARNDFADWNLMTHKPSAQISGNYLERLEKGLEAARYLGENKMKILVVNPIYGGSLPTAHFCVRALKNLGHDVESVDCENFAEGFSSLNNATRNKGDQQVLSAKFMNLMGEMIVAQAADFKPDLILALAQAPLGIEVIQKLRSLNVPIGFWFVEDFRSLEYWKDIGGHYDYFFAIQDKEFSSEFQSREWNNFYYLPQACCPDVQKPLALSEEERGQYEADLSFMGAAYYNRVQSFPRLMDFDCKIWGTGWEKYPLFKQILQNNGERTSEEECVKIYNSAKINLNLHSSSFHEGCNPQGDFVNPRTFEIAACSGFQLVDERSELADMFDVGEEIIAFKDVEDLKSKIQYYLDHQEERDQVAAKSRARVLREHTMEHRMVEMLAHIFSDHLERFKARSEAGSGAVETFVELAGPDSELGRYLKKYENEKEFSFHGMIDKISEEEGKLSGNELLLLMLGQVIKEGKQE